VPKQLGRREAALGLALPLVLLAAWWYATAFGGIKVYQLASPADVVRELAVLWANGELAKNLVASIGRVAFGFAVAFVLAIAIGTSVGLSPRAERMLDPTLQALRAIPSLAWVPLLLLWLGIGETAKIVLIAIGAFFPIYVSLVAGIRGVDRKLVEAARVLGVRGFALAQRVLIPATLPQLLTGARIGLTQAWLFLVAAELLAASKGLGFLLTEGQQISRTDEILVAIIAFAVCGKLTDLALRALEGRVAGWVDTETVSA
jgi:sulfonate transport system permease protein